MAAVVRARRHDGDRPRSRHRRDLRGQGTAAVHARVPGPRRPGRRRPLDRHPRHRRPRGTGSAGGRERTPPAIGVDGPADMGGRLAGADAVGRVARRPAGAVWAHDRVVSSGVEQFRERALVAGPGPRRTLRTTRPELRRRSPGAHSQPVLTQLTASGAILLSCPVNDCSSSTTKTTCARCSRRPCATSASTSIRWPTGATRSRPSRPCSPTSSCST